MNNFYENTYFYYLLTADITAAAMSLAREEQ